MSGGPIYDDLGERLFAALPELRVVAADKFAYMGDQDVGSTLVYEDVLDPHLGALLDAEASPERNDELRRIFALLEDLAQEQPVEPGWDRNGERFWRMRSIWLVQVSVIEFLEGRPERWIPLSREFMGPRVEQLLDDAIAQRERHRAWLKAMPWRNEIEREMLERSDAWFARLEQGQRPVPDLRSDRASRRHVRKAKRHAKPDADNE